MVVNHGIEISNFTVKRLSNVWRIRECAAGKKKSSEVLVVSRQQLSRD